MKNFKAVYVVAL